jgi:hypothetical protein
MSAPTTMRAAVTTGATHGTILGVLIFAAILAGNWLTAPVVPPAPQPPAPVVVPAAEPESAYVFDETGKRTDNPDIERTALTLKPGRWKVVLIPKANDSLRERWITISETPGPVPPVVVPPVVPPVVDPPKPPEPPVTVKATAAVFVYEKDAGGVPGHVLTGLNRLNREKKILATLFEDDAPDGTGEVPEQYKVPLKAAQDAGLPALVVTAGNVVLKVVKAPKTEAEMMEAVQ